MILLKKESATILNLYSVMGVQFANYVLPIITLPIIARIIGPEKYGSISYVMAFTGYFVLIINSGFDIYGAREIAKSRNLTEEVNEIFNRILFTKLFLLLVCFLLFFAFVALIPQLREEWLICFFSFGLCVGWVFNPSWLYNGMQDSKKYALFSFFSKVLFIVSIILLIKQKEDYIYHPLSTAVAHILISGISFYYASKKYNIKLYAISWIKVRRTLKDNFNLSLSWWVSNQVVPTSIVLSGFVLSTHELGTFSSAIRLIMIQQLLLLSPMSTVLYPYFCEGFINSNQNGIRRVQKVFPIILLVAGSITAFTFYYSNLIIEIFYGSKFIEAGSILQVLSFVLVLSIVNNILGMQILSNISGDRAYRNILVLGFLINSTLTIVFAKLFGSIGIAFAWPLSELLLFLIYLISLSRKKIFPLNIKKYNIRYYHRLLMYHNNSNLIKRPLQEGE